MYNVVKVIRENYIDQYWVNKITEYVQSIENWQFSGKGDNYLDRLNILSHFAFDVAVDEFENIVTFAGIYNGGRYPKGVYRVLNRTFVSPKHRSYNGVFKGITTQIILKKQLDELQDQLKLVFVSREGQHAKNFLNFWVNNIAPNFCWEVSQNFVQVVPGARSQRSYQYIAYCKLKEVEWFPDEIGESDWLLLNKD